MLKKIAAGFSAAKIGKMLLDFGKEALQAASDLEEVQNVVDVTFGAAGAAKIEEWAKKAGTQFGLTETQAKKFTSTLGAMMKSAGLTGDEITNMSTDLAGLAADMASFYNLDFDTAFQKIRSGISGETEPLKQLGINMSVANLNAFALKKGLEKTFDQMTQGEQTMLRYQYIMQATSDAQGDFARTSDGYANSMRQLTTNLDSLKTTIGTVALPWINKLLEAVKKLFPKEYESDSILDKIAKVNLEKDEKIAEITEISKVAQGLIDLLNSLGADDNASTTIGKIAEGANKLNSTSAANWGAILSSFQGIDGLDIFGTESGKIGTIEELASALSGNSVTQTKAEAWETFLSALADNSDKVSELTGQSAGDTEAWLRGLASAAKDLKNEDVTAWTNLMSALVSGVDMNTDKGKQFVQDLANNFLAMGSGSKEAVEGLTALGFTTSEIEQKQATWLETCKQLVSTIPGLSDIIDTNTGEIKGGIPALKEYADEWERTAKAQAEVDALQQAIDIYKANNNQTERNAQAQTARATAKVKLRHLIGNENYNLSEEAIDDIMATTSDLMEGLISNGVSSWDYIKDKILASGDKLTAGSYAVAVPLSIHGVTDQVKKNGYESLSTELQAQIGKEESALMFINSLSGEEQEALLSYAEAQFKAKLLEAEMPQILEELEKQKNAVAAERGITVEELEAEMEAERQAAQQAEEYSKSLENVREALANLSEYVAGVRQEVASTVNSNISGFSFMKTAAEQAKEAENAYKSLEETLKEQGYTGTELQSKLDAANKQITAQGMKESLDSQLAFIDEYKKNLEDVKNTGLIDEKILAQLSDGSNQSAMYLHAMAEAARSGDKQALEELNDAWKAVNEGKESFVDTLTQQKLAVDEQYDAMVKKAEEAAKALDVSGTAGESTANNIQAMADAIKEKIPSVAEQVDAVLSELNRLNGWGINFDFGVFGSFGISTGNVVDGEHETGLDRVPFDGYLASLHEGEGILTAEENRVWQRFKNGQPNMDYDTLGGVMRDNIKPGGNVFLDGRVVGEVISQMQGNQYRTMQRSGWQQ